MKLSMSTAVKVVLTTNDNRRANDSTVTSTQLPTHRHVTPQVTVTS
jgi:hypothetical protein